MKKVNPFPTSILAAILAVVFSDFWAEVIVFGGLFLILALVVWVILAIIGNREIGCGNLFFPPPPE